jgi:hypothetical protein
VGRTLSAAGRILWVVVLACGVASCGADGTRIVDAYGLPDSSSLELSIDTCGATVKSVDVEETAEEVRISVETEGGEGPECLDSTVAELDEPLGDRRVVDASTGNEVEVSPADG